MGLVTGSQARSPRIHSQWVVDRGRTPERTSGWGWESARPRRPHTQARGAPTQAPSCRPRSAQSQLARARAVALVTGLHARIPRAHSQCVVGPGPTPGKKTWPGLGERSTPALHTQARGAPPQAPSCRPRSAQSQLARACAVALVTGHHARIPRAHSQCVVGPGRTPQKKTWSGPGERPSPAPPTQARAPPPPGRPHAAPTARKASSQERSLWGW